MANIVFKAPKAEVFDYQAEKLGYIENFRSLLDSKVNSTALKYLEAACFAAALGSFITVCFLGLHVAPLAILVGSIALAIICHSTNSMLKTYDDEEVLKSYQSRALKLYYGYAYIENSSNDCLVSASLRPLEKLCQEHRLSNLIKHKILSPKLFGKTLKMELKKLDVYEAMKLVQTVNDIVTKLSEDDVYYLEYRFIDKEFLIDLFVKENTGHPSEEPKKSILRDFFDKYDLNELRQINLFESTDIDELVRLKKEYERASEEFIDSLDESDIELYENEYIPKKMAYTEFVETCQALYASHHNHSRKLALQDELVESLGGIYENTLTVNKPFQDRFVSCLKVILGTEDSVESKKLLKTLRNFENEVISSEFIEKVLESVSSKEDRQFIRDSYHELSQLFDTLSEETESLKKKFNTLYLNSLEDLDKTLEEYKSKLNSENNEFISKRRHIYEAFRDKMDKNTLKERELFLSKTDEIFEDFHATILSIA